MAIPSSIIGAALPYAAPLVVLAVAGVVIQQAMRDKWDLVLEHGRDLIRHALALLLMLGTLAGTVWTFSNGSLSISGIWESLVSVGGIAAALELGVIYTGIALGDLDARIQTARRADVKAQLQAQRKELTHWFYATAAISAVANLIFRTVQLGNFLLALLPAGAPILLVILFAIKLRPLPRDYQEIGRQSAQRGLVMLATQAQASLMRSLRKIARGHVLTPQELAQMSMAISFQRAYVSGEQAQALDQVIAGQLSPQLIAAPGATGAGAGSSLGGEWLSSADVAQLYAISERTAQGWISQTPGRRQRAHSRAWEAPAAALYAAHGVPAGSARDTAAQTASGSPRRRKRSMPQAGAMETQSGADETPASAVEARVIDADPIFAVYNPPAGERKEPAQDIL